MLMDASIKHYAILCQKVSRCCHKPIAVTLDYVSNTEEKPVS